MSASRQNGLRSNFMICFVAIVCRNADTDMYRFQTYGLVGQGEETESPIGSGLTCVGAFSDLKMFHEIKRESTNDKEYGCTTKKDMRAVVFFWLQLESCIYFVSYQFY
nr:uncharacterized protein LOC108085821 [Drosophila kikkawai]